MGLYIPRVRRRPALRQLVEGTLRTQALFITQVQAGNYRLYKQGVVANDWQCGNAVLGVKNGGKRRTFTSSTAYVCALPMFRCTRRIHMRMLTPSSGARRLT